jgi:hypothetical protein
MVYLTELFGYAYNSGGYGSSTYATNGSTATGTAAAGESTRASGSLSNTGFDILAAASLACLIIFAALVIKFWRRPAAKTDRTKKTE